MFLDRYVSFRMERLQYAHLIHSLVIGVTLGIHFAVGTGKDLGMYLKYQVP